MITRVAAYACPVPRSIYDELAATESPIGIRLQAAQRGTITDLWRRCHASGVVRRRSLPARCDPAWFRATFCRGAGAGRGADDEIWDVVGSFNMYDAIALVACVPALRAKHLAPAVFAVGGVDQRVVGVDAARSGVVDENALTALLCDGFHRGLASTRVAPEQRTPLSSGRKLFGKMPSLSL